MSEVQYFYFKELCVPVHNDNDVCTGTSSVDFFETNKCPKWKGIAYMWYSYIYDIEKSQVYHWEKEEKTLQNNAYRIITLLCKINVCVHVHKHLQLLRNFGSNLEKNSRRGDDMERVEMKDFFFCRPQLRIVTKQHIPVSLT